MATKTIHPNSIFPPALDVCDAEPSSDYTGLKRQFFAIRSLLNVKNAYLHEYHKKDYELATLERQGNIKSLDSERDMNCLLTNENLALSDKVDKLTQEVEALKRVISNSISDVKSLKQCRADEMVDSSMVYYGRDMENVFAKMVEHFKSINTL